MTPQKIIQNKKGNDIMKNANGYTINAMTNTVTITKDFAKRANDINSPEYKTLRQLRQDGYSIEYKTVKTKAGKVKHKGLTIDFMDNYISYNDNRDQISGEYIKVKAIWKGHPAYYAKVKQWFLNQFPELTAAAIREEIEAEEAMTDLLNELEMAANVTTTKEINKTAAGNETAENKENAA